MTALMAAHHTDPPDRTDRTNGIVTKGYGEKFTHNGKTLTIYQWAKEIGVSSSKLYHRIKTYGWPLDEALKLERRPRPVTYLRFLTVDTPDGPMSKPMSVWSDELGIPMPTISRRLSRGWSDAQALEFDPSPREQRRLDAAADAEASDPFQAIQAVKEQGDRAAEDAEPVEEADDAPEWDPDPFRIFPQED